MQEKLENTCTAHSISRSPKNISRFWNLNHCKDDVEKILHTEKIELQTKQSLETSFGNAVTDCFEIAFDQKKFAKEFYSTVTNKFSNEEWEFALVKGLKSIFPDPIIVERTGGPAEKDHGTDILIRLPGLLGFQYLIAIQVKDYSGPVGKAPIKQITKADHFWNDDNCRVIDKYLIITKANREDNASLIESANGVKIIFANELQELLTVIGKSYLGLQLG